MSLVLKRASVVLSLIEVRENYEECVVMMFRVLTHFEREMVKMQMHGFKRDFSRSLLEDQGNQ